jgi:hypothetical protein
VAVSTVNALSGPYTTNGATTVFPFTFTAPSAREVAVSLFDANCAETTVGSGSYTVRLGTDGGGSVTFDTAPASGYSLYVLLDPDFTQDIQFEDGSGWLASPVNLANDRAAARDQYLKARVDKLTPDGLLTGAGAGQFLSFDGEGNPVFSSGTGADAGLRTDLAATDSGKGAALVGYAQPFANAAERDVFSKLGDVVNLLDGDGTAVHDTGTVNGADTTAAINQMITNLSASSRRQSVIIMPPGVVFAQGIILKARVRLVAWDWQMVAMRKNYTCQILLPAGAVAGFQIKGNTDAANPAHYCGILGIETNGNSLQGFGGIDLANNATTLDGILVCDNCPRFYGEQAIKVNARVRSRFERNRPLNSVMYRTRASHIGVMEIEGNDLILNQNEPTASLNIGSNIGDRLFLNGSAGPRIWAGWIKAGSNGEGERNVWQVSEGGLRNDGLSWRLECDRYEFNLGEGLNEGGYNNTYQDPEFDSNGMADPGTYGTDAFAEARFEERAGVGDAAPRLLAPAFKKTSTAGFAGGFTPGNFTTVDVRDVRISTGVGLAAGRLAIRNVGDRACKVVSDDPRVRMVNDEALPNNQQNGFLNSSFRGATIGVIGSGGVLPPGLNITTVAGLTQEILAFGFDGGLPYLDVKISGAASATAALNFRFDNASPNYMPAALAGETWTGSLGLKVVSDTGANQITFWNLFLSETLDNGGNVAGASTSNAPNLVRLKTDYQRARPLDMCRHVVSRTFTDATTRRVRFNLTTNVTNGNAYNFTLRIAVPQIERAPSMGQVLLTNGMPVIPRVTQTAVPADGGTVTCDVRVGFLALDHTATIASATVVLPPSPQDGQEWRLASRSIVTALTLTASNTIRGTITTIAAGGKAGWRFVGAASAWFPI